jgi:trimeric autotransporter adhesin
MPRLQCGAFSVLFSALSISIGFAQSGIISTYVGPGLPANGGAALNQPIDFPASTAPDGIGGYYVASFSQNRVYRVDASGKISLAAGNGISGYSGDGRSATSAQLNSPWGLVVDSAGNLYIADMNNNRVRKVTTDGVINTIAGNGSAGYSGDDIAPTSASLNHPTGLALGPAGNLFIADRDNSRIRRIMNGVIKTYAGNGATGYSGDGGSATAANFSQPSAVAVDSSGNLYIADFNNSRIRKVLPNGTIGTVAGNGSTGFTGDGGQAIAAQIGKPIGVAIDSAGNFYIADSNHFQVRKVTTDGVISTVTGTGTAGFSGDGGPATVAQIGMILGVTVFPTGGLYISDASYNRVRKVTTADGLINTVAGNGVLGYSGDNGFSTAAQMRSPHNISVDSAGNLYIADQGNHRIRKVAPNGVISTFAGYGTHGYSGDSGLAIRAQLNNPGCVIVDSSGNLYIGDGFNFRIRKVTTNGTITTVVGTGTSGYGGDGGSATAAQISWIEGMAFDSAGNLYFSDYANHRIRKVTPGGIINTVAGTGTKGFSGDGGSATAANLSSPAGVAVDSAGNIYTEQALKL